jgi:uncharacterized protein (TIGR03435 family)
MGMRSIPRRWAATSVFIASALLATSSLSAQRGDSATTPQFEVASIKPVTFSDEARAQLQKAGGTCALPLLERSGSRVHVQFSKLCGLIRVAYDVADYQIVGIPNIEPSEYFEIDARAWTTPTIDEARVMLQSLLAERFRLRVHREPREAPVYVLTAAKGGPKKTACTNPEAPSVYTPGRLLSCRPPMPMARVAQLLGRETHRPVLVDTELTGPDLFELYWLPEGAEPQPDSPPSLFTAIQEQLGLKLEARRGTVDAIVVDHVEGPSPN